MGRCWISDEQLQSHFNTSHVGLVLLKGGITRYWLGNKIFEYMAASLAVVNNVEKEAAELVSRYDFGANVSAGDASGLADALARLADHPLRLRAMMANSTESFLAHFDRQRVLEEYVDYLEHFLAPPHDAPKVAVGQRSPGA
jgi:glycosyltransferase involved in cell wall biosynthesis